MKLLKFFSWLILVALVCLLVASLVAGYEASLSFMVSALNEEAEAGRISQLVTKNKFIILQVILLVISCAFVFILVKFNKVREFLKKYFSAFKNSAAYVLKQGFSEALLILILPVSGYIFFAFYMPVYYDEASTWLNFTSRSPLVSMLYYPTYNNHILHSVITNFTYYIPFLHPLQAMRISSILASILTCMLLYSLVRKYYSPNAALVVTGISSVLFMYIFYSFASRGYALVNLFFVFSLFSAYKIIFENNRLMHWTYFSLFSLLGFYAMPSFLYPFITLNLVILLSNPKAFPRQLLFGFLTAAAVTLFYLPVIAVNGIDPFLHNKQVYSASRIEILNLFPGFASDTLSEVTGINIWITGLLSLVTLLTFVTRKQKFNLALAAAFIIAPLLVMLVLPKVPFARTFCYYGIALPFIILIPLSSYLEKIPRLYIIAVIVLIQSAAMYNFFMEMKSEKQDGLKYAEINKQIAGDHRGYYVHSRLWDVPLVFELETRGFTCSYVNYTKPLVKVSADTINYDYVIIDKAYDATQVRAPLYSDRLTNVYKKSDY